MYFCGSKLLNTWHFSSIKLPKKKEQVKLGLNSLGLAPVQEIEDAVVEAGIGGLDGGSWSYGRIVHDKTFQQSFIRFK